MPTTYTLTFNNSTGSMWVFVVYATLPNSESLPSVAWLLRPVPQSGNVVATFDETFDAVIGTRSESGGFTVYSDSQHLPSNVGAAWKIVVESSVQQLSPDGSAPSPEMIQITNASGTSANAALGIFGAGAVYNGGVFSGASAIFVARPTYYVLLANAMTQGQVIARPKMANAAAMATTTIVGPQPLGLTPTSASRTVTAAISGQTITLTVT